MSTFYHKETILNEVAAWAEKSEQKADLSRSVFARDVVSVAAHQLSSAIAHVKDFIGLGQDKNSAVQAAPLTMGYLDRYFNKQSVEAIIFSNQLEAISKQSSSMSTHNHFILH